MITTNYQKSGIKQEISMGDDVLDDQLRRLVSEAQQHPPNSTQRRKVLNRLVKKIQESGKLNHFMKWFNFPDFEDIYHEAQAKTFLDYLTEKEQAAIVNLRQWIGKTITEGWQTIDELLHPQQIEWMGCRSFSITRGKKIDLGLELNGESVALIVTLAAENQSAIQNQDEVNILIQVSLPKDKYIPGANVYISEGLKVAVIDDKGEEVLYTTSRQNDNWIEVEFSAQFGEKFSVDVILGESKVTQEFVV